jgi:1-deoxy-D-xylulose-5-phosphate reductoisomerase
MKTLSILGSTGSIGTQALDIVSQYPGRFKIKGLAAGRNIELLKLQIQTFEPEFISVGHLESHAEIESFVASLPFKVAVFWGQDGLEKIATLGQPDMLLVAVCGTAAIKPTYLAILNGTEIALASKEVLVSAGAIIMDAAKTHNVPILPVDSEHAALHQCLKVEDGTCDHVAHFTLTASGGPFRDLPYSEFPSITKEMALKHPNWDMGHKVTLDSATLMNKGLEVIEAHHLFEMPFDKIKVIIHPQSIVHCLVEFIDGNIVSHLGCHDMHFAIQYALTYPIRLDNPWPKLNLAEVGSLSFYEPDIEKFPLLKLAYDTGSEGGVLPAVMNAANEAAVHQFLSDQIPFNGISKLVIETVERFKNFSPNDIDEIVALDLDIKQQLHYEYC